MKPFVRMRTPPVTPLITKYMSLLNKMAKLLVDGVQYILEGHEIYIGKDIRVNGRVVVKDTEIIKNPVKLITDGDVLNIETVGDVEVQGNVQGDVTTASGDVTCGDVNGDVETMSGDVEAKKVGGDISTMSGDITVR